MNDTARIRILSVEEDRDFCSFMSRQLGKEEDLELIGWAHDRKSAVELAEKLRPDIVLMDFFMTSCEPMEGIEAAREIRFASRAKLIFLTGVEEPQTSIEACKRAFASGYIYKRQLEFVPLTVRKTAAGHTPQEEFIKALILSDLSAAERTVLDMILGKDIRLLSAEKTIANQKTNICRKLGVRHPSELIRLLG